MKDDPFAPFLMPTAPPQGLGHDPAPEVGPESLRDLLFATEAFNEDMALELAILCRQHASVRAALLLPLQLVRDSEVKLRNADDMNTVKFLQGEIAAAERSVTALITMMEHAEAPTEQDNQHALQ